jgi:hypothetical protein
MLELHPSFIAISLLLATPSTLVVDAHVSTSSQVTRGYPYESKEQNVKGLNL